MSNGMKSEGRDGRAIGLSQPIHRASRSLLTSLDQCAGNRLVKTVWMVTSPPPEGVGTHESYRNKLIL